VHDATTTNGLTASAKNAWIDLSRYDNCGYFAGRGPIVRSLWYLVSLLVFESAWVPFFRPKRWLLRRFGAKIGRGVVIKPQVRIKYPWRLVVGDHCWIGQDAWIDNLADIRLGDHVCLSQRVYLCTGSHDHRRSTFDLITRPITIDNGVWLCAGVLVLGGSTVGANAVVTAGTVVNGEVPPTTIASSQPAHLVVKPRRRPS
jgi:putative colanic acid biosynthesis acetyltransferase WcaF